jgi:WD40 repeat protein
MLINILYKKGIDFSSNGKYMISCGDDRAIFLWSTKEFELQQHK